MANQYLDYTGLQHLVEKIDQKYAPIAALIFKGTVANISALPNLATLRPGYVYNVEVGGGTTSDFIEGAGHILGDGENVAVVELITGYNAVPSEQVTVDKDPKALGWYESDGQATPSYTPSNDRIADPAKTYYTVVTVKKWDILGGVFDLEGRYLEFGEDFPQGPANRMVTGRTFLYLGDTKDVYTAVETPTGRPKDKGYFEGTFTEVQDTSGIVNPKQVPLYVIEDETAEIPVYVRTEDIVVDENVTYYEGEFEASEDVVVAENKVYYTKEVLYAKSVIYKYDATEEEWIAQSSGSTVDLVPITNAEIDELFI